MHPNGREGGARDRGARRVAPVRDAVPVQITTLGALAVDGRPVRGDRLVTLLPDLLDSARRTDGRPPRRASRRSDERDQAVAADGAAVDGERPGAS